MSPAAIFAELFRGYMNEDAYQILDEMATANDVVASGNGPSQSASVGNNNNNGGGDTADADQNVLPEAIVEPNNATAPAAGATGTVVDNAGTNPEWKCQEISIVAHVSSFVIN